MDCVTPSVSDDNECEMDVCDPPNVCIDTDGGYECACSTVLEPLGGYYNQQIDEYSNVCISKFVCVHFILMYSLEKASTQQVP